MIIFPQENDYNNVKQNIINAVKKVERYRGSVVIWLH